MEEREIGRILERLDTIEKQIASLDNKVDILQSSNEKRMGIQEAFRLVWTTIAPIIAASIGALITVIFTRKNG